MIEIFFLGVIGLWFALCLYLAVRIPKWFGWTRFRYTSLALLPILFLAPVADEIIAYPQLQALCESTGYELAMPENEAYGRTIYLTDRRTLLSLWPSSVIIEKQESFHVDTTTKATVIHGTYFEPKRGWLGVPAGSSGDKMTLVLNACPKKLVARDAQGLPAALSHLKLTKVPTP